MVTNLPAEAKAKWIKVMDAKTPEEKIQALQEFLSTVPKHKGTENLVMWARRRMAELKEEVEKEKRRGKSGAGPKFFIEKDGAGQVLLLGDRESRCKLMNLLTEIDEEPKETPIPGITYYEDVRFQVINPPELIIESRSIASKILALTRNADLIVLTGRNIESVVKFLEDNGIFLGRPKGKVVIERVRAGKGIRIVKMGKLIGFSEKEIVNLLHEYNIVSGTVKLSGEVTIDDVEKALFGGVTYKPGLIVGEEKINDLPVAHINNVNQIKRLIFELLDIIRVYTKEPGEEVSKEPVILRKGATVLDLARTIHSQIAENFKYAKVQGRSVKYPQRVGLNHVLEDGDIVELRSKV
ncbi:GTP-binding protein [Sulfolobales archaeon HS-7]|nr:GTP-binding protein [Sulfolobales archaeon HS-7]